jgi:hypothetical protein
MSRPFFSPRVPSGPSIDQELKSDKRKGTFHRGQKDHLVGEGHPLNRRHGQEEVPINERPSKKPKEGGAPNRPSGKTDWEIEKSEIRMSKSKTSKIPSQEKTFGFVSKFEIRDSSLDPVFSIGRFVAHLPTT